ALFGTISGSASAAAAAVGSMVKKGEEDLGYDKALSAAANGASAPSGLLIPPSNALITYSLVSGGTSVAALFLGGYLPGLIWTLGCLIVTIFLAKKKGYTGSGEKFSWSNLGKAFLRAIPSLGLIIVVIGGIVKGVFTATEGSAISVLYALILGLIYKNLNPKKIWEILVASAKMSGIVVFLIGVSNILSWVMAFTGIPQMIGSAMLSLTDNPIIILLIMNVILLLAGTFMDVTPAILIFTPLFLPIVTEFGMHPVHFGLIIVYNLCIGNITTPVGNTLFVAIKIKVFPTGGVMLPIHRLYTIIKPKCTTLFVAIKIKVFPTGGVMLPIHMLYTIIKPKCTTLFVAIKIGDTTLAKVMPYMLRYYALILLGLLLVTYVPAITLSLPQAAGLL